MYTVHDSNGLDTYTSHTRFGGGEVWEDKLHKCYCSCAIQHVTWYVSILLTYYSRVSHEISWATCMQVSSLNWAVLYVVEGFTKIIDELILYVSWNQ